MRKRDELTDPSSCMSRARENEMTFVLLGRDIAAPVAIRAWIEERIRLGKNSREDAQIAKAERCAEVMAAERAWRRAAEEVVGDLRSCLRRLRDAADAAVSFDDRPEHEELARAIAAADNALGGLP